MGERRVRWNGVVRFDPERTARYHRRTMPRPKAEYRATPKELEAAQQWELDWRRNQAGERPPLLRWMDDAHKWAQAQGHRGVHTTVEDDYTTGGKIIRWEPRP